MAEKVKMSRYSWLMSRMDPEDTIALEKEMLYFSAGPKEGESTDDVLVSDKFKYSVDCLCEQSDSFRSIPDELSRVFAWHMTTHGHDFWMQMHAKYVDRRFVEVRKRIAAVSAQTETANEQRIAERKARAAEQLEADAEFMRMQEMTHEVREHMEPSDETADVLSVPRSESESPTS